MWQHHGNVPVRGQLSVLTALITLGYTLGRFLDLPTRLVETSLLGAPITFQVNGQTISLLLVTAIIITGCDALIRSHPRLQLDGSRTTPAIHCIMPCMGALALAMLLTAVKMGPEWWLGLALGVAFLTLLLLAEYVVVDGQGGGFQAARLGLTIMFYATVLGAFNWLIGNTSLVEFSAPVAFLIVWPIAFRLFVLHGASYRQACINGFVVGLVLGEFTWVLVKWAILPLGAAILLLTTLHLATGLIQNSLTRPLARRTLLEYGVVGGIALGTVFEFALQR